MKEQLAKGWSDDSGDSSELDRQFDPIRVAHFDYKPLHFLKRRLLILPLTTKDKAFNLTLQWMMRAMKPLSFYHMYTIQFTSQKSVGCTWKKRKRKIENQIWMPFWVLCISLPMSLTQLSWQCVPAVPVSHKPYKLISTSWS